MTIATVVLSEKSHAFDAADAIAEFVRHAAPNVKIDVLSDVIAPRHKEEGLDVLNIMCDSFFHSELESVDLQVLVT